MKFKVILISALVAGCGSESDPTISPEFTGVWQQTSANEQAISERYLSINSNGSYRRYLYRGDSKNNFENCYDLYDAAHITLISENEFLYVYQDFSATLQMEFSDDTLSVVGEFEGYQFHYGFIKSDLFESDLEPICD